MKSFSAHGKLLLTGEYLVLKGAIALGLPTRLGQSLTVQARKERHCDRELAKREAHIARAAGLFSIFLQVAINILKLVATGRAAFFFLVFSLNSGLLHTAAHSPFPGICRA